MAMTILHDLNTPHPDHGIIGPPSQKPATLRVTLH